MAGNEFDSDVVSFVVQIRNREAIDDIAASLSAQGLHIDRVLRTVGVIGGHGPAGLKGRLSEVTGVGIVREEGSVQLPPFDEQVPQ